MDYPVVNIPSLVIALGNEFGVGEGFGSLSVAVAPVSSNDTAGNMWDFHTYFYSTVTYRPYKARSLRH